MELDLILNTLMQKYPSITIALTILGTIVVLATAIIKFTPSKKDDEMLSNLLGNSLISKILNFIEKFSLIKKKDE